MLERVGELVIVERFQYQGLLWRPLDLPTLAVPSELWTHNPLKRAPCHCTELLQKAIAATDGRTD